MEPTITLSEDKSQIVVTTPVAPVVEQYTVQELNASITVEQMNLKNATQMATAATAKIAFYQGLLGQFPQ